MATTTINEVFDIGNKIAGSEREAIQEAFEILPGRKSNLVSLIGYGPAVTVDENMRHNLIVDEYLKHYVVANGTALSTDSSITVDDAGPAKAKDLLKIGDETARITGVNYDTNVLTVSRSISTNAAESVADDQELILLPSAHLGGDYFPLTPTLRGEKTFFYPQQIMDSFEEEALRSGSRSYFTGGVDELVYSEKKYMVEMDRKLAGALVYNEAVQPTRTVEGSFAGFDALITDNVNSNTLVLTATKIVNLLELLWEDSGEMGELNVLGNSTTKRVWDAVLNQAFSKVGTPNTNSVGFTVDSFMWNGGTLNYQMEHFIRDGDLFFIRPDKISINPLDVQMEGVSSGWQRETFSVKENKRLVTTKAYWGIFLVLLEEQRLMGKMKAITTTGSSYAGYV